MKFIRGSSYSTRSFRKRHLRWEWGCMHCISRCKRTWCSPPRRPPLGGKQMLIRWMSWPLAALLEKRPTSPCYRIDWQNLTKVDSFTYLQDSFLWNESTFLVQKTEKLIFKITKNENKSLCYFHCWHKMKIKISLIFILLMEDRQVASTEKFCLLKPYQKSVEFILNLLPIVHPTYVRKTI